MFKYVRPLAGKTFQEEFRSAGWCKENSDGQKTVAEDMGFNSLVHSLRALSTLRRSSLRTTIAAAKPCQGDSSEFYLKQAESLTVAAVGKRRCEHAGLKVTTLHGGNTTTRMIKRFTVADDLKESSKITQVKGTKLKEHHIMYKEINA
ncbi:hypothetical protein Tco_0785556 [Tanacetum coccineum]